jgi:uncharacterized protein YciI
MSTLQDTMDDEARQFLSGLRRLRLHVAQTRPVRALDDELSAAISATLMEHWRWLLTGERDGWLFAAGPFLDEDGAFPGDGMLILRADSLADAVALAEADPMVVRGLRTVEVRSWELNEGSIGMRVSLATGRYEFS